MKKLKIAAALGLALSLVINTPAGIASASGGNNTSDWLPAQTELQEENAAETTETLEAPVVTGTSEEPEAPTVPETSEEPEAPSAPETPEEPEAPSVPETPEEPAVSASVQYQVHMQDYGWMSSCSNGEEAGVTGESKRMEALRINIPDTGMSGTIRYRVHVQDYGWQDYRENGELAGTEGEAKRVEAIQMYLTGELAEVYDIYYTLHIQNYGWLKWTKGSGQEDGLCGSSGLSLRAESIRVMLLEKGTAPEDNGASFSHITKYTLGTILYSGHQQDYGDLSDVYDGGTLGITGKGKRLEAFAIEKGETLQKLDGDIMYRAHVQDIGTQNWVSSGQKAGTSGQSKRVEAIQIYLTGELAAQYDIYYRVHVQEAGWMKWVAGSADESGWAGTEGLGFRIEALQIQVLSKGSPAPSDEKAAFGYITKNDVTNLSYSGHQQDYGDLAAVTNGTVLGITGESKQIEALKIYRDGNSSVSGSVQYRVHVQDYGWMSWGSDGAQAGTSGEGKRLEALKIKLTGDVALFCDIWYRTHVQDYGWLGWAKNGQTAGTSDIGYRIEAVQIMLVPKGQPAPGTNSGYYTYKTPGQKTRNIAEVLGFDPEYYVNQVYRYSKGGTNAELNYYLGTPYPTSAQAKAVTNGPYDLRSPKGDMWQSVQSTGEKVALMQCTGFVWHFFTYKAAGRELYGGNIPHLRVNSIYHKVRPYDTSGWAAWASRNKVIEYNFTTKKQMLSSGKLHYGDIVWVWDSGGKGSVSNYHHVGIYVGDGTTDEFWSSMPGESNKITDIRAAKPASGYTVYSVVPHGTCQP